MRLVVRSPCPGDGYVISPRENVRLDLRRVRGLKVQASDRLVLIGRKGRAEVTVYLSGKIIVRKVDEEEARRIAAKIISTARAGPSRSPSRA